MPNLRIELLALLLPLVLLTSCGKKAEREWSPADHDRLDDNSPSPQAPQAPNAPPKTAAPAASGPMAEANAIWQSNCANCHGATGKGDGPAGRALRVPDLTGKQAKMTDDQIAGVIKSGRGGMPAFNFSPEITSALVKKIRTLK